MLGHEKLTVDYEHRCAEHEHEDHFPPPFRGLPHATGSTGGADLLQ